MDLKEPLNGIQHIGIPTNDIVYFLPMQRQLNPPSFMRMQAKYFI